MSSATARLDAFSLRSSGLAGHKGHYPCPLATKHQVGRSGYRLPADTLGTGFRMRAIARRPECATATGSPEGGGRLALPWEKARPDRAILKTAAPNGAPVVRRADIPRPRRQRLPARKRPGNSGYGQAGRLPICGKPTSLSKADMLPLFRGNVLSLMGFPAPFSPLPSI